MSDKRKTEPDGTAEARKRRWQAENRAAMEAWNEWHKRNGLTLERYRLF
jgi:post-segregation antitoxin (ccd killing protein)